MKKLTLLSAIFAASMAQAEVSFNAAATSNYVWRGDTQTADASAVQGGVDYAHESGLAAGVWTSSIAGDTEVDYYASFGGETGALSYEVGAILYDYNADALDFTEAYVSVGFMDASLTYYKKVNDNDDNDDTDDASYVSLGYGLSLAEDLSLDLAAGQTLDVDKSDDDADKYDVLVSLTKSTPEFDFTLSWTKKEDAETGFQVGVSKGF